MPLAGGRQETDAHQGGSNEAEVRPDAKEKSRLGTDKAPQQRNHFTEDTVELFDRERNRHRRSA